MFASEGKIDYGFATGYHILSGKTILGVRTQSRSFLPLALALRFNKSEKVVFGADESDEDEDADVMGKLMGMFGGGGKKKAAPAPAKEEPPKKKKNFWEK